MAHLVLLYLHVGGAVVILGAGTGLAVFMVAAHFTRDIAFIARSANVVLLADLVFTATAIVVQPLTGFLLVRETGAPLVSGWVALSIALYMVAGVFWLPIIWMQARIRSLANDAVASGGPLPRQYHLLFRVWFALAIPAIVAVLAITWLMIAKPMF